MEDTLLHTKLYIPPPRPSLVRRKRLLALLDNGLIQGRSLTLISAPAGYGKSVLSAEWLRSFADTKSQNTEVFWLSLDEQDNDPVRFLTYLVAALKYNDTLTWRNIRSMLRAPHFPSMNTLMTGLINGITEAWSNPGSDVDKGSNCFVLVLDDYHKIRQPLIHEIMQFMLDHGPPQLHLVLVTREDPPLSLSRMRVQGEMTEIRAKDLRFNNDETTQFIYQEIGQNLHPDWIKTLSNRTEGWIAGLQLAALSMDETTDISTFIVNFHGSHRHLIDYLMDEVLLLQPEDRRQFLCRTSILERFNASLCDVLTERNDSQRILNEIEQLNLFLIPLDDQREWYRYHHLFADCLCTQLNKKEQITLRKKTAGWFEANGDIAEAIHYALATGDCDFAADIIEHGLNLPQTWSGGQVSLLEEWLTALPETCVRSRPNLQIRASRVLFLSGKLEQSATLLEQAEETLLSLPLQTKESYQALAQINIYKGAILAMNGQISLARTTVSQAMGQLPEGDFHAKARAFDTLGLICDQSGDYIEAVKAYLAASDAARTAGVSYLAVNARCEAAMLQILCGQLTGAEITCREALADSERIPPTGLARAIIGEIMRERNELALAEQYLSEGIELSHQGGITDDLRHEHIYLIRLRQSQKDRAGILHALQQEEMILQSYHSSRLTTRFAAMKARILLTYGEITDSFCWANEFEHRRCAEPVEYLQDYEELTLVRIKLAQKQFHEAQRLLAEIIPRAQENSRLASVIEGLMLNALAFWYLGHKNDAEATLIHAMILAQPESYMRIFLDEGKDLYEIMSAIRFEEPYLQDYCRKLRLALQPDLPPVTTQKNVDPTSGGVIEPLTAQEQKILNLIANGLSNQEIAGELVITLGTAKWHVHNIYEKLGVNSRTQAIVIAQELKIV